MSPGDAQLAIDHMCAATDRVLFSSSPGDFNEPTHINTHQTPRGSSGSPSADCSGVPMWT